MRLAVCNYPAVVAALRELGCAGPVGLEAFAHSDSELALRRFADVFSKAEI
ncbi:hypothetical protein [Kribbella sp. NPDC023855]|uniref:hypothetical protein n=1 Tax=Kribbella sp. NPDC023855 TaxID=3154698 RepID=UPI0033FF429C